MGDTYRINKKGSQIIETSIPDLSEKDVEPFIDAVHWRSSLLAPDIIKMINNEKSRFYVAFEKDDKEDIASISHWRREKEIQRIKCTTGKSFPEASKIVETSVPTPPSGQSYAKLAKPIKRNTRNMETQTIITWPRRLKSLVLSDLDY